MASKDRLIPVLWSYNDLLWTIFAVILVVTVLVAIKKPETPKETARAAGNVSVYVFWRPGDIDIDTHLRDPNGQHIYFSQRAGTVWNLLRDDLGNADDLTASNFENAYARGLPAGEYIVNVHAYRNNETYPVMVEAELRIEPKMGGGHTTFTAHATLDHLGDEATMFRFSIDATGNLVPGSINNQFLPLAKAEK